MRAFLKTFHCERGVTVIEHLLLLSIVLLFILPLLSKIGNSSSNAFNNAGTTIADGGTMTSIKKPAAALENKKVIYAPIAKPNMTPEEMRIYQEEMAEYDQYMAPYLAAIAEKQKAMGSSWWNFWW